MTYENELDALLDCALGVTDRKVIRSRVEFDAGMSKLGLDTGGNMEAQHKRLTDYIARSVSASNARSGVTIEASRGAKCPHCGARLSANGCKVCGGTAAASRISPTLNTKLQAATEYLAAMRRRLNSKITHATTRPTQNK